MDYLGIRFTLGIDPLSGFFLGVIFLITLPAMVYAIGYLKGRYPAGQQAFGWAACAAFIASMSLVVTVRDAFAFLIVWECMSLASYFLVTFDGAEGKSVRAGTIYIVMTHLGTACITVAILMIYRHAHSFDFAALKNACIAMPSRERGAAFLFFLIGFGTKAGIVPFHVWLPDAHPQAPSHVSSVMSGVMIKTAVYGMLRFIIGILGIRDAWWGGLVLALATVSCLVGVTYALMEHDLKRLLAYSSVENIGVILLGVGASMLFAARGMPVLAVFALVAGLYHLVNHAIFKGLLFLCAGSVHEAVGTRNMEKLGGLIRPMPWTSACFLAGALALSAIPPLNGFVSEWLTLQALFLGALGSGGGYAVSLSLCAALLALTGGLAAACFVKAFGISFLGMPRSAKAEGTHEAAPVMIAPMVFLAALTAVFGLAAAPIVRALTGFAGCARGMGTVGMSFSLNNFALAAPGADRVFLSPPLVALVLVAVAVIAFQCVRLYFGPGRTRSGETWGCGYYALDCRTEYTATGFAMPFRRAFDFFLLPYIRKEKVMDSAYHLRSVKFAVHTTPVFLRYAYEPLVNLAFRAARQVRKMQPGSIHLYLTYIFITIVCLIVFANRF